MHILSRRRAMILASSFAAAFPFLQSGESRAQVKPGTGVMVFEMADFIKTAADPDAAFAQALATIAKSASDANKAGKPVHIAFNLEKNVTYKIKHPLLLKQLSAFELNGNGARLINATLGSTLLIRALTMARVVKDPELSPDILQIAQKHITNS